MRLFFVQAISCLEFVVAKLIAAGLGMHQTCPEGQAALHARDLGAAFLHWRALESSAATEWKRSQFHPFHP